MRHLAGSLLTGILLQFHPLFAQDEFTASVALMDGVIAGVDVSLHRNENFHSDSTAHESDWDFSVWDSHAFNPYQEQDLHEPFFLAFSEENYAAPVAKKLVVTSRYGWRDGQLHRGIDIDLVTGDEVYAILDGKVRYVRSHAGHGKTVVIRHKNGVETIYAHLSKQLVEENQLVKKGEIIGKGGTTGNARGSHLHLEVRYQGVTINPEYFFDFEMSQEIKARESWITEEVSDPRRFSSFKKPALQVERELAESGKNLTDQKVDERRKIKDIHLDDSKPVERSDLESEVDGLAIEAGPYTIKYGDTLYSLARKHDTTVEEICRMNGIKDSFKIKVGQKIVLDF